MPVIGRRQVDPEVRKKFEAEYKAGLRRSLSDLSLTEEHRTHLMKQLASIGQPKVYRADSPSKHGAISVEKVAPAEPKKPRKGGRKKQ